MVVAKDRRGSSASLFVWYFHISWRGAAVANVLGHTHPCAARLSVFFHHDGFWQGSPRREGFDGACPGGSLTTLVSFTEIPWIANPGCNYRKMCVSLGAGSASGTTRRSLRGSSILRSFLTIRPRTVFKVISM